MPGYTRFTGGLAFEHHLAVPDTPFKQQQRSAVVDPARDLHDAARGTAESVRDGLADPSDPSTPVSGDAPGHQPGVDDHGAAADGDMAPDGDDARPGGDQ